MRRWTRSIPRLTAITAEHGAEAILPYDYLGNEGVIQGLPIGGAFFNKLGASVAKKIFCGSGSSTAWLLTNGPTNGTDPMSFAQSKLIVIWGCNSISTNIHHWHIVKEAQRDGAKVVVIDPYRSRTAKEADWHIQPRPGTDGVPAMAMIHVITHRRLGRGRLRAEHVRRAFQQPRSPPVDEVRMHVIRRRRLGQRLLASHGSQSHLGLEPRAMVRRGRPLILPPDRGQHGRRQIGDPLTPAVQFPRTTSLLESVAVLAWFGLSHARSA